MGRNTSSYPSWTTYIVLIHGHHHAPRSPRTPSTGWSRLSSRTDRELSNEKIHERWNLTSDTSSVLDISRRYARAGSGICVQATCAKHLAAHYLRLAGCGSEHQARIQPRFRNKIWNYWCLIRHKWCSQHTSSTCKTCTAQFKPLRGMVMGEQISPSWSHSVTDSHWAIHVLFTLYCFWQIAAQLIKCRSSECTPSAMQTV